MGEQQHDDALAGLAGALPGAGASLLASERGLRRAEEEARTPAERLGESNRLKDLFIDIVRHDLLNPASVIRYYTTYLQDCEPAPAKKECYLKIEGVNNRLMDLIRNASKYSRLEEMDHVDCQELDLGALLLDALAVPEHRLKEAGKAVNFLPRGEYPITANPMLEDVFANLVANAIKYAPDGKRLELDILDQGGCWLVQVRDLGKGIPDKDKPLIFTRFTRLKKEGVEGSGLGLAIVKRLVDLHKGRIWVESQVGVGSVFSFTLLREQAEPEAPVSLPTDLEARGEGKKLIMCIDDDPGVITLYKRYLEKQGYQVIGVTDPTKAVGISKAKAEATHENIPLALLGWSAGCAVIWSSCSRSAISSTAGSNWRPCCSRCLSAAGCC